MCNFNEKKVGSYKYDLYASISTVLIIILGNVLEKGTNPILKIVGLLFFASAIFFWIAPIITLKKYGNVEHSKKYFETRVVVDKGIYSLTRHPQYLAYMFLVSGFAFIFQNWIIYLITVLAIVLFYMQSIEEEKEMIEKNPEDYKEYCEKVGRFNISRNLRKRIAK